MQRLSLLAAALLLLPAFPVHAQVRVVCNRNENRTATSDFRFDDVPPPSQTDAGTAAVVTVVAGRLDPNGNDVAALHDGLLSASEDEPGENCFFAAGTPGGRLRIDLGEPRPIRRVNTYSWHTATRGPQVYRLYAADGSAEKFSAAPAADVDPETVGWKRIASVDTRPGAGPFGGQYGVSVSGASGVLGHYRYLLLDVSRTEAADPFGNTFFSEIDIDDGRQYAAPAEAAGSAGGYQIVFNTAETPELAGWVERVLRPACEEWYPKIAAMLPSEGYTAPRRVTITFLRESNDVAYAAGTRIVCGGPWFQRNRDGEAAGAVIHELVHVVQHYGSGRRGNPNPGWLVEGIADYVRWFHYEPASLRPRPNPAKAHYTDSYRTTAAFLDYVSQQHGPEVVQKLNAAMRKGDYSDGLWKDITGRSVDELWAAYVETLGEKGVRG